MMVLLRHGAELLPERNDNVVIEFKSLNKNEHRTRRGKKFGRIITKQRFSFWLTVLAGLFLIYVIVFGAKMLFHSEILRSFSCLLVF